MTGEEHYREAERLLDQSQGQPMPSAMWMVAKAQAHATLAQAAAQSHVPAQHGYPARDRYGAEAR